MTISKQYGPHIMELRPHKGMDSATVSLLTLGERFPLQWSKWLPMESAHAALTLFESIGPFDIAMIN